MRVLFRYLQQGVAPVPLVTILFGIGLIPIGWVVFEQTGREHFTALIPVFLGVLFILLGSLSYRLGWRKHTMHTAAMVGLLGAIGSGGRAVPGLINWFRGETIKSVPALVGTTLTALICLVFVLLCVRSFIAARVRQRDERTVSPVP